ncbi:anaphase-promoting complex component cut20 [Niveomyces insectorum RCEF 264]|uniref:Anaphase-promoting complex subunit 4 n=1 Tax=Niveomyces insectorum RCEF 264 TaxID=1081102 RepID=A0A168A1K9_9HYPO|nr:anaphase-promoting complex component cut20 [Niveomyces insectorum RCEF 264]
MAATSLEGRTTCPFLLKLFYRHDTFHRLDEFAASHRLPSVSVYTFPTCSLGELTHHLAAAHFEPGQPPLSIGTRVAFRLVYADTRGVVEGSRGQAGLRGSGGAAPRFVYKDVGSVVIGGGGPGAPESLDAIDRYSLDGDADAFNSDPDSTERRAGEDPDDRRKTLADMRFVVGDYISCAILPPLPNGCVAPPPQAINHGRGFGSIDDNGMLPPSVRGGGRHNEFQDTEQCWHNCHIHQGDSGQTTAAFGVQPFSQSIFNPPADRPELVAACPTIDLTAAVGGGNVVYVRRRGGETVSKLTERNKEVQALAWRADGQYLAVAWSDGVVRLVGLESPKAVHQIRLFEGAPSSITCTSWSKNLVGSREAWQSHLLDAHGGGQSGELLDLPRALMFLEVEDDLPELLPLPVSGGSGDDMFVFSTRTSLEFMFPPLKPSDGDFIYVMVLGTADGTIHVSIYDAFVMGTFTISVPPKAEAQKGDQPLLRLRHHASHPASSTHVLLLANEEEDDQAVFLALMDFTFIYSSPLSLSLLAFKTTTFQKLLRYIKQTQIHMQGEWQAARELPSKFLANIQEDLQKDRKYKHIDHALRVAALTGFVSPTLKQWLVDTIAERGHKRWDKAVVTGLENLRDLIHENMMPALDRAILALSRLRGLAEFHGNDDIGFTAGQISQLMDILSCLVMVSHNALALVTAELELFVAFSTWMRSLIERLALPSQAEEQAEKEPNMSITPVLDYITNHLLASPLELHFAKASEADWNADWAVVEQTSEPLLDMLEAELEKVDNQQVDLDMLKILQGQLQRRRGPGSSVSKTADGKGKQRDGQTEDTDEQQQQEKMETDEEPSNGTAATMKAFPKFEFLARLLSTRADSVLKDIAQSGRRHVHFGPLTRLSVDLPIDKSEVSMAAIPKEKADFFGPPSLPIVYVFRSSVTITQGTSSAVSTGACVFALSGGGTIIDFRFLGAEAIVMLWAPTPKDRRHPRVIAIPVQSTNIGYQAYNSESDSNNLPVVNLDHDGTLEGIGANSLCWVADLGLPAGEGDRGPGAAARTLGSVVRMEVLPPTRSNVGETDAADQSGSNGNNNTSDRSAGRVCLMHADGATYRVFTLPSLSEMFGRAS